MPSLPYWLGLIALILPAGSNPRIEVRLSPGPYLVGQAIAVDVTVTPRGAGAVAPPAIPQAELRPVTPAPVGPADDGADHRRFILVPTRAGPLAIPPFRATRDGRALASRGTTIAVASVPPSGRTAAFLGGIGEFRVAATVEPNAVRVGQPVEFRITLTGPAAAGSGQAPDLGAWAKLPAAFEVRGATTQVDNADPPTRTFWYRLRPTRPGRAVLPPVAVAAFDPVARRYATRTTASLVVDVADTPRFDPATIDYPFPRPRRPVVVPVMAGMILAGGALAVGWLVVRRRLRRRRDGRAVDWRDEAIRLRRWAAVDRDPVEGTGEVAGRLADAIGRGTGQSVAVLTPPEAEAAIQELTRDVDLARRAAALVATSDRLRFDPATDATAGDLGELVAEAVAVFEAIGRSAHQNPANEQTRRRRATRVRPDRPSRALTDEQTG